MECEARECYSYVPSIGEGGWLARNLPNINDLMILSMRLTPRNMQHKKAQTVKHQQMLSSPKTLTNSTLESNRLFTLVLCPTMHKNFPTIFAHIVKIMVL